jgi:hypothetical protein
MQASADFPELEVEARWERDGLRGRVLIQSGRIAERDIRRPGEDANA